jgi:general secretion pathway protein D
MSTYRPPAPGMALGLALAMALVQPVMSAAEPAAPPCAATSSNSDYGIEMIDLIDKVAKRTGKQFIVDPRVRAIVPRAGIDLDKVDYAKLLAILSVHQFGTYEANGVVRVVPDANARQMPIPVTTEIPRAALDDEYVTVMITAKNMCMAQAVPVLRPLMPQAAHMASYTQSNTLIISDRAANARRIVDLVERLDKVAPAGQKCPSESGSSEKRDGK